MTKTIAFLFASLLAGCSAQTKTVFIADFENACSFPVQVRVQDYSNAKGSGVQNQYLEPGRVAEVLSYISFGDDLESSFPATYRLTLSANGSQRSLNKQQFLAQLKRSDYQRKGNAIHTWAIRDASLCPRTAP
ncbi:hypothetical protein [Stutzerimonas stutzeri]|uniref:hypothetical protein n=1 Tax=Stutzerimonas stutzeri TaxID=316 RepID=UPI000379D28C|nr:hypothetical protein [Stutzerimonas stutzeri]